MKLKRLSILLVAAAALVVSGCGLKSGNELEATITPTPVVTVAPTVAPPSPTPVPVATATPTPAPKAIGAKSEGAAMLPIKNDTGKVVTGVYIAPCNTPMDSDQWGQNLMDGITFEVNEIGEFYYNPQILNEEGRASIKVVFDDGEEMLLESVNLQDMKNMFLYIKEEENDIYVKYDSISEGALHDSWLDYHDPEEPTEETVEETVDTTDSYDTYSYTPPYTSPYGTYNTYVPQAPTYDQNTYTPPAYDYSYTVPTDGLAVVE